MANLSGRVFTASLKPHWTGEKITDFLELNKGAFSAYVINHDKDIDADTGELVEPHTHFYIEYDTPRKLSTVANLLGVAPNFIEIVRNKMGALRYLTHKDQKTKAKYDDAQVHTNADIDYTTAVMASNLTDRQIADYIANGKGIDLLGIVPSGRLRTIQSFLHFDRSGQIQSEIANLNAKLDMIVEFTQDCKRMADNLVDALQGAGEKTLQGAKELACALGRIKALR
jgi:hypothetical protein